MIHKLRRLKETGYPVTFGYKNFFGEFHLRFSFLHRATRASGTKHGCSKPYICFYRLSACVIAAMLLTVPYRLYAQEPDGTKSFSPFASKLYARYARQRAKNKPDSAYLKYEGNMLKVRIINTIQAPRLGISPLSNRNKEILFRSQPLEYIGFDLGWNIFSGGYSISLNRTRKSSNERFSFNTYTRFFALNLEAYWLKELHASNSEDSAPDETRLGGSYFRTRSAQVSIFTNGRKMAYGNTINPVYRQIKSAGTFAFALTYSDYRLDMNFGTNPKDGPEAAQTAEMVGIDYLKLFKYEVAAGYSYNFVAGRHWVLFVSDMIGLSAKHYSYEMLHDEGVTRKATFGGCNYARLGACYYNKNFFIGLHAHNELDILQTGRFIFKKSNTTGILYAGYKFKVDRFNEMVSKLLNMDK